MALAGRFATTKPPIQNDAVLAPPPKPLASPSIIERFRAALKEREEEIRASMPDGDDEDVIVLPPTMDEIVRLYEVFLSELTFNSKPIITDLTIIAGEQREHAQGIADAISSRILEVPVEQKLPSLYLLDSVVKNIGREYARYFAVHLPEVFCEAYRQVHPSMHPAMRHLFGTWSTVFPASVLRKIETRLQFSQSGAQQSSGLNQSRASESPRPTHGIHVNPKYLEARRQLGHSVIDSGRAEDSAGHISSNLEANQVLSTLSKNARSSSPYRVGPARALSPTLDEFALDSSAIGLRERASPSHSALDYGLNRVRGRDDERSEWQRILPDDTNQQPDNPVKYGMIKGIDLQGPRALIDAYGIDEREKIVNHSQRKMENAAINGVGERLSVKTWQNTEEEEFNWEDMSPTLADQSPFNDLSASIRHPQGIRMRSGIDSQHTVPLVTDPRRSWPSRGQYTLVHDSPFDDVHHPSGRGTRNKITGYCDETSLISGSHYLQKLPQNVSQLHQSHLKGEGSEISSATVESKHPLASNFAADGHTWRPPYVPMRINHTFDPSVQDTRGGTGPASVVPWPPINAPNPQSLSSKSGVLPHQHIRSPFDVQNASNSVANHSLDKPVLPQQQIDNLKINSYMKFPQFSGQHPSSFSASHQNPEQMALSEPQLLLSQHIHQTTAPRASVPVSNHLQFPPNYGYTPRGPGSSTGTLLPLPASGPQASRPLVNVPNTSSQFSSGALLLPRGPPSMSSQFMPTSQNLGQVAPTPPGGGYSSLFSSLMAQGLISLTNQAPTQDSVGLEFNPDLLKVRHDSAVTALYADLPRQCTTCGLRFKCQEAHSSHMDWHVTKNRVARNRKQKSSRKWFVSVNMWLSGTEALGSDAVPGFLPTEQVVEKKDEEELAVPADDEQNACALCGEPFDDFYSDETEEWMYRGAVYMNAPSGSTAGIDRSQLGPIIHAKCRSDSSAAPNEDSRSVDEDQEDGTQRKRLRS